MKVSVDFGRWTTTKAALVVAGLLAIGGAVGSAVAISPTIAPPIKWQGGWEKSMPFIEAGNLTEVTVVPAGKNLLITDIVASNQTSAALFHIYLGGATCSHNLKDRLVFVWVPASNSLHVPLETGIGFAAGQRICVSTSGTMFFNFRGFLFTPS